MTGREGRNWGSIFTPLTSQSRPERRLFAISHDRCNGQRVALSRGQRHAFTAIILAGTHVLLREFPT